MHGSQKKTARSWKASGKVPLDVNGPNLSNKRKKVHSSEIGETEEVINAANHFHRQVSRHFSLGLSQMLPPIV